MNFNFVPPYIIESDDPSVYVIIAGPEREQGRHFVLHMNGKQIGFATASFSGDEQTILKEDGSKIWRIGEVGCAVLRRHADPRQVVINVGSYQFTDFEEQTRVIELIAQALLTYSGKKNLNEKVDGYLTFAKDQQVEKVEFTEQLMQKVKSGELLK